MTLILVLQRCCHILCNLIHIFSVLWWIYHVKWVEINMTDSHWYTTFCWDHKWILNTYFQMFILLMCWCPFHQWRSDTINTCTHLSCLYSSVDYTQNFYPAGSLSQIDGFPQIALLLTWPCFSVCVLDMQTMHYFEVYLFIKEKNSQKPTKHNLSGI